MIPSTSFNECKTLYDLGTFARRISDPSDTEELRFSFLVGRRVTVGGETVSLSAIIKKTELLYSKVGPALANNRNLVKKIVGRVGELNGKAKGGIAKLNFGKRLFANISLFFRNLFYNTTKHMTRLGNRARLLSPALQREIRDCVLRREFDTLGGVLSKNSGSPVHFLEMLALIWALAKDASIDESELSVFFSSITSVPNGLKKECLLEALQNGSSIEI